MANQSKLINIYEADSDIYDADIDTSDADTELDDSDKENQPPFDIWRSGFIEDMDAGTVEEVVNAEQSSSRKEFSYKQRHRVHVLRELGWTMRQISDHTQISLSCVHQICNTPVTPTKRRGRQLSLNTPIRKRLIDFVQQSAANRRMTFREVAFHCGK